MGTLIAKEKRSSAQQETTLLLEVSTKKTDQVQALSGAASPALVNSQEKNKSSIT